MPTTITRQTHCRRRRPLILQRPCPACVRLIDFKREITTMNKPNNYLSHMNQFAERVSISLFCCCCCFSSNNVRGKISHFCITNGLQLKTHRAKESTWDLSAWIAQTCATFWILDCGAPHFIVMQRCVTDYENRKKVKKTGNERQERENEKTIQKETRTHRHRPNLLVSFKFSELFRSHSRCFKHLSSSNALTNVSFW